MPDLATALGPTFFVIAVGVQPLEAMDNWKARGINTLVEIPEGHDMAAWVQAADSRKLYQIRHSSKDPRADLADRYLLAWATDDEPSDTRGKLEYGSVRHDPAQVAEQAASWRAAARAAGRFVPIWTNHVGSHIWPDWAQKNVLMHDYMEGPESDWLSADSYPVENRRPIVIASNDGYASTQQGITIDRQIAWSRGKPVMSFIGVSAFGEGDAVPTAAQFNVMAWSSVIHGAVGVAYFPVRLKPWLFDATPPDLVAALTAFDRQVTALDKVLMDSTAGGRKPHTVFRAAHQGAAPAANQLPYPFEADEIPTARGPYRIVLNLSDQDATLDRPEWGLNKAAFHGYEVRQGYGAPAR
jgi:hypothetical protein